MKPPACIVGSAPSILGTYLGSTIDDYQFVSRINHYKSEGYIKDIGEKLTHWYVQTNQLVPKEPDFCDHILVRENPFIYFNPYIREAVEKQYSDFNFHWIHTQMDEFQNAACVKEAGIDDWQKWNVQHLATTGLLAIIMALNEWGKADIAGFGASYESKPGHYFNGKARFYRHHDLDVERELINRWVEMGLVRRLDENRRSLSRII